MTHCAAPSRVAVVVVLHTVGLLAFAMHAAPCLRIGGTFGGLRHMGGVSPLCGVGLRLLLDSRGVEVPRAYTPTFVLLSSLQPFFFKSLKKGCASRTTREHKTLESNKSAS